MGEMKRAIAHEERQREVRDRFASTLVIAASIIATVRLARDDISKSSPRLTAVVPRQIPSGREMAAILELEAVLQGFFDWVELFFDYAE